MPRISVLFAILLAAALQAQTAPAQAPAGQQQTTPPVSAQQPAQPTAQQSAQPTAQQPAQPTQPQPSTQPPASQSPAQPGPPQVPAPGAPAVQAPPMPTPPARQNDPDRDTALMLLDRVQKLANDALAGQSKSGKVTVDRASLNEIIAAAAQIKTALQR